MKPRISIVTCSYQQGRFLDATIRSVLDQQYPNLEYIVIDGGSKDESVDIIRRYQDRLAYWVSERDEGQTHALIKGFNRATGEIQGWLCSDDLLLPGALDRIAEYFDRHPDIMAVYGDALWIDADGALLRPKREMSFNRFVFHYAHNYVPQPSMYWRRPLYDRVGGLDAKFVCAMDTDLWSRFSEVTDIAHLPAYLSCMRYYEMQKTRSLRSQSLQEDEMLRSRYRPRSMLRRLPAGTLGYAARSLRFAGKVFAGGYTARVPDELRNVLGAYHTRAAVTSNVSS